MNAAKEKEETRHATEFTANREFYSERSKAGRTDAGGAGRTAERHLAIGIQLGERSFP